MVSDDKVSRALEKLKSQGKNPEVKKQVSFFKDISEMDFDSKDNKNNTNEPFDDLVATGNPNTIKIEALMRKIEEIKGKMSAGSNYLMYYSQIHELESQFLEITNNIESQRSILPPQLFNRILYKKQQIMIKRKR